jgi:hypothetical protein
VVLAGIYFAKWPGRREWERELAANPLPQRGALA